MAEPMADAVVDPPVPMAAAVAESLPEADWKRFTPAQVSGDKNICMARVWGNGAGGQCSRAHDESSPFCIMHHKNDRWKSHGRVDGPIPEAKLKEFLKASSSAPRVASTPPPKRHKAGGDAATPESAKDDGPKKPVGGGFSVFKAESLEAIKAVKPADANFGFISKEASERWKALTEEQQSVFQDKFAKQVAAYEAMPHHNKEEKKHKRVQEKFLTPEGDALKRPVSGYSIFCSQNRESIKSKLPAGFNPITDVAREAGVQWKALSEKDKKVFNAQHEQKMQIYRNAKEVAEKAAAEKKGLPSGLSEKEKKNLQRKRKAW